jgi:hypothetical protein
MVSPVPLVIALQLHNVPEQNVNDETSQSDMSQMYNFLHRSCEKRPTQPDFLHYDSSSVCHKTSLSHADHPPFLNIMAAKTYFLFYLVRSL